MNFSSPEPMSREEFEYTEEEIALELKKVEKTIKEKNLITIEDIHMAYGEAIIGCALNEYYASQEPDYFDFDKRHKQALKEIEEEQFQQNNKLY